MDIRSEFDFGTAAIAAEAEIDLHDEIMQVYCETISEMEIALANRSVEERAELGEFSDLTIIGLQELQAQDRELTPQEFTTEALQRYADRLFAA